MIIDKNNISIDFFHNSTVITGETNVRKQHFNYVLNNASLIDGHILEFGVFKGKSLTMLSEHFLDQKVFGFDSFEGLPEDWIMTEKELKILNSKEIYNSWKFLNKHKKGRKYLHHNNKTKDNEN